MAAEEGQVIAVHSIDAFQAYLDSANESKKLISLLHGAGLAASFIAPILAEIAKHLPQVVFLKVDVDELKKVAEDWAVESMPTFVFVKEGTIVDKFIGAHKDNLISTINKHAGGATASA